MDTTQAPLFIVVGLCALAGIFLVRPIPQKYWRYFRRPPRSEAEHRWQVTYAKAILALVGVAFLVMGLAFWLFGPRFAAR